MHLQLSVQLYVPLVRNAQERHDGAGRRQGVALRLVSAWLLFDCSSSGAPPPRRVSLLLFFGGGGGGGGRASVMRETCTCCGGGVSDRVAGRVCMPYTPVSLMCVL